MKSKCPDCKSRPNVARNGDWRCRDCGARGVTLDNILVVSERFVTISNPRGGYALNQHYPAASLLTKLRAKVAI